MLRCHFCVANWVDRAASLAEVKLTDLARRRLIASLLSRPHLILSGPTGIGKARLAPALALSGVDGQRDRMCRLQGHPWWAAGTGNVGRFVELHTDFSLWRLAQFANSVLNGGPRTRPPLQHQSGPHAGHPQETSQSAQEEGGPCGYVVYIERMSPVEIELYFRVITEWLVQNGGERRGEVPLRLVGTYDSSTPAMLDERLSRLVALVQLGVAHGTDLRPAQAEDGTHRERLTLASL